MNSDSSSDTEEEVSEAKSFMVYWVTFAAAIILEVHLYILHDSMLVTCSIQLPRITVSRNPLSPVVDSDEEAMSVAIAESLRDQ